MSCCSGGVCGFNGGTALQVPLISRPLPPLFVCICICVLAVDFLIFISLLLLFLLLLLAFSCWWFLVLCVLLASTSCLFFLLTVLVCSSFLFSFAYLVCLVCRAVGPRLPSQEPEKKYMHTFWNKKDKLNYLCSDNCRLYLNRITSTVITWRYGRQNQAMENHYDRFDLVHSEFVDSTWCPCGLDHWSGCRKCAPAMNTGRNWEFLPWVLILSVWGIQIQAYNLRVLACFRNEVSAGTFQT